MLKESDLREDHDYISKNTKRYKGKLLSWRKIFKINHTEGYVVYCEMKYLKNGFRATSKTITIQSFLRWAVADVTKEKK